MTRAQTLREASLYATHSLREILNAGGKLREIKDGQDNDLRLAILDAINAVRRAENLLSDANYLARN